MPSNTATLDLVSLDYDAVRQSLRDFMATQPEFQAYDFDQGGLAAIIKLLAFNSWNEHWLLNFTAAEGFLDSAQLMTSVSSHVKELGYCPASARSARARIRMTWTGNSSVYYLQKGQEYAGLVQGAGAVTFTIPSTTIVTGNSGSFSAELDVYEGPYVSDMWIVNSQDPTLRYLLTNDDADTSSVGVSVYEGSDTTPTTYAQATSLLGLTETSRAWFLQVSETGRYEIVLGDGVSGFLPPDGSRMIVDYRVTKGPDGNGVSRLTASFNPFPGDADAIVTTVLETSSGGVDAETIESVRFRGPRHFRVQERAVNDEDYAIILQEQFPEIAAAQAVGGGDVDPPQYGRVIVAVDLSDADLVSESRRTSYEDFLRARASLTVRPVVVDPTRMYVSMQAQVWYDTGLDVTTPAAVQASAASAIQTWCGDQLAGFGARFSVSHLQATIDAAAPAIVSSEVNYSVYQATLPTRGGTTHVTVRAGFSIEQTPTDSSSSTTRVVEQYTAWTAPFILAGDTAFAADDGLGAMRLVQGGRYGAAVGSVDYESGVIDFPALFLDDYTGAGLRVYAVPRDADFLVSPTSTVLSLGDDLSVTVTAV